MALFATAAGRYGGLDGLLRPSWRPVQVRAIAGASVMRTRDSFDRAALALGVVSIVSAVFVFVHGTFSSFK